MVITFCNGKGGVGKTTLAMLIAMALIEAGHQVAVQDLDPQYTATRWARSVGTGLIIAEDGRTYGSLIIDTPPRLDSPQVANALERSDIVVVVSSPSPADLFTSQDTAKLIRSMGLEKRTRLLFNGVHARTILARELNDVSQRVGLRCFQNKVHHRQAYQHAALMGWKALPSEAREELLRIAVEVSGFYGEVVKSQKRNVA